jgi:AcrR family transcriptional regulator
MSTSDVDMRKRRAPYHHGRLGRALVDAVIAHAAETGSVGGLTLREAARRAGVSHNAPYRHFEDKLSILAAAASEGFAELSRALRAARAGVVDARERFVRTGLAYLRFAHTRRGHLNVMFGPEVAKAQTRELQEHANDAFTILEEMVGDAGVPPGPEARRLGAVVWSFVHGLAVLTIQKQVPSSVTGTPEELAELGLRHWFDAICASAAERNSDGSPAASRSARSAPRLARRPRHRR